MLISCCRISRCKGQPPDFGSLTVIITGGVDHDGIADLLCQIIVTKVQTINFKFSILDRGTCDLRSILQGHILQRPGIAIAVLVVVHEYLLLRKDCKPAVMFGSAIHAVRMLDTFIGLLFGSHVKGVTCRVCIIKEEFIIPDVAMRIIGKGIVTCIGKAVGCISVLILDHTVAAAFQWLGPYEGSIQGSFVIVDGKVIGFGYIEGIDRPIQICIPMVGAIRVSSINIAIHISLCIRVILGKSDVAIGTLVDKAISLLFVHIRFCLVVAVVLFSCRIIIGRYTHLQKLGIIKSVSCIQGFCLVCSIAVIVQLGLGVCSVKSNIAL